MRFETPETVEGAVALLAADAGARVLAGGTDLLVRLRAGHIEPSSIVDIKRIAGMNEITSEEGGWRIGAGSPARPWASTQASRQITPVSSKAQS